MANIVVVSGRMVADPELRKSTRKKPCAISGSPFPGASSLKRGQTVIFSMQSHGIGPQNSSANIFPKGNESS